ncbi:hypothetical protein B0H11DRAFT_1926788 [Mycena galericulata]|nr:hypothetical protein B0H11DRAFT_1926788 [Mycena galericulata]
MTGGGNRHAYLWLLGVRAAEYTFHGAEIYLHMAPDEESTPNSDPWSVAATEEDDRHYECGRCAMHQKGVDEGPMLDGEGGKGKEGGVERRAGSRARARHAEQCHRLHRRAVAAQHGCGIRAPCVLRILAPKWTPMRWRRLGVASCGVDVGSAASSRRRGRGRRRGEAWRQNGTRSGQCVAVDVNVGEDEDDTEGLQDAAGRGCRPAKDESEGVNFVLRVVGLPRTERGACDADPKPRNAHRVLEVHRRRKETKRNENAIDSKELGHRLEGLPASTCALACLLRISTPREGCKNRVEIEVAGKVHQIWFTPLMEMEGQLLAVEKPGKCSIVE